MVFSSIPVYLDPPNWHHQQPHHTLVIPTSTDQSPQLPPLPPPPAHGSGGSIRPGSMADRARQAKIPQPEAALKCPRCESANTKFCYFNNYSLTQPRHFCKTCRRYWTRGGALRSVPVGGGCRRNKKSSKTRGSSKSPAGDHNNKRANSNPSPSNSVDMIGQFSQNPNPNNNPSFIASIQNLARLGGHQGSLGLNFDHGSLGFQMGTGNDQPVVDDQWRLQQQFPFFGHHQDFDPSSSFHHGNIDPHSGNDEAAVGGMLSSGGSRVSHQPYSSVKLEGRVQGLEFSSRPSLGFSESNSHFWAGSGTGTAWTDLSGLNSASTSHLL